MIPSVTSDWATTQTRDLFSVRHKWCYWAKAATLCMECQPPSPFVNPGLTLFSTGLPCFIGVCRIPMWFTMPVSEIDNVCTVNHIELQLMLTWHHDIVMSHGDSCLQTWQKTSHRNSASADTSNLWLYVYFLNICICMYLLWKEINCVKASNFQSKTCAMNIHDVKFCTRGSTNISNSVSSKNFVPGDWLPRSGRPD